MIAIREHTPATLGHSVCREREPRPDRRHAARERRTIVRFHDQMRVIALQRIVHQPKSGTRAAGGKGAFDRADDTDGSQ